jgi:hypothetical protein
MRPNGRRTTYSPRTWRSARLPLGDIATLDELATVLFDV